MDIAIGLNPIDGVNYKLKGAIYRTLAEREFRRDRIEELFQLAIDNETEAIRLLPYDARLYLELGQSDETLGRLENAEAAYRHAIELEPNFLMARQKQIDLLVRMDRKQDALQRFRELNDVDERLRSRATSHSEQEFIYFDRQKLMDMLKS